MPYKTYQTPPKVKNIPKSGGDSGDSGDTHIVKEEEPSETNEVKQEEEEEEEEVTSSPNPASLLTRARE